MGKIELTCKKGKTKILTSDYVVVGVGLAGSVMVGKLSGDLETSVIGIEAGNNNIYDEPIKNSVFAGVEYGLPNNYFPEYFYQQRPVPNGSLSGPQPEYPKNTPTATAINCSLIPINQTVDTVGDYTTGRILGGGSSINGEQYVRGTSSLYQEWAAIGGPQWSPQNATNGFVALENYHGLTSDREVHGYDGPVSIRQAPVEATDMSKKFVQAVTQATGLPQIPDDDYNNPATPLGPFNRWELFQKPSGERESAATAFLGPKVINSKGRGIKGRRILLLLKTLSNKLIWDSKTSPPTAKGIRVISNGRSIDVYARKRVILCQGIHSAELLQRSGVGPKDLLTCLGIPVIYDNPNVGRNFTNQILVPVVFNANPNDIGLPPNDLAALYTGGAFLPPLLPDDNPNLRGYQLIGAWIPASSANPNQFSILLSYLQPKSRGVLRIQSTDPTAVSLVDNNYLGDPRDMEAFVAAFQVYVKNIAIALASIDPTYVLVAPTMDQINDTTQLQQYIIANFNHTHHWMMSNRMGQTHSVVDGFGNVLGVNNLTIVDNSSSPHISDGNTAAPVFLMAYTIANHLLGKST
jgi:choline dehydrogenase